MSRTHEVLIGIVTIVGGIIAYPWVINNVWDDWLAAEVAKTMPDNAWGDAFMAGAPIGLLIVIIAFGLLLILGKLHGKDSRDIER
jgi:hypothetical protein